MCNKGFSGCTSILFPIMLVSTLVLVLPGCEITAAEQKGIKGSDEPEVSASSKEPKPRAPSYPYESSKLLPDGTGKDVHEAGLVDCVKERILGYMKLRCSSGPGLFEGLSYQRVVVFLGAQGHRMGDGSWEVPALSEVKFVDLAYDRVEYQLGPISYPASPVAGFRNRYDYILATRGWIPDAESWHSDTFPRHYFKQDTLGMMTLDINDGQLWLTAMHASQPDFIRTNFQLIYEYSPDAVDKVNALSR